MRLLHVTASMNPELGGVCQAVRTIVAGLAAQGVQNEVASLDAPAAFWQQPEGFVLHTLGPGRGPWHYSASFGPWLLANCVRFDAVILHGLWQYPGYALRQSLRRLGQLPGGTPHFFVMPHGMLDPYFQRAPGRRLKAWRNLLYWQLVEKNVINEADSLLFTCETEQLLAQEPFAPYCPRQAQVVGLGVPEPPLYQPAMQAAFRAVCPTLPVGQPYLLFLSRLHEKKGVDLLLQAYARLARVPAVRPVPALVIAGPGLETPYGLHLRQLATDLPAEATVFFPGMLAGSAKWGAFFGCEAFVLPSHQENFGIAVVEALACGKPVLISDQVNIWREIATAGGGLVAPDTLAGTAQLLEQWHRLPPAEQARMGQQAKACFRTKFAVTAATEQLLAAISP
ncbi:MAG: glycosyltransferase [Hymenobacter sp.]|nr:MAG: glycosyltransferase [Hymenobacter sp.]